MASEERVVKIVAWPKEPADVKILTPAEDPLRVDMAMNLVAKQIIPVCIKLCEPICASSEYTIGIDFLDRPLAAITVRGQTRLFNCQDEKIG